ncbi:hypothetical protein R1flu_016906 [Riccia fluitans]|uniref:Alcohol dehydrogenase 4 n=1 Tax=Riccia fluitans TaxID=41844 RepID=A0ABD1YNJ4_9MARC
MAAEKENSVPEVAIESLHGDLMDFQTQGAHGINYHHLYTGTATLSSCPPVLMRIGAVKAITKILDEVNVGYVIFDGTEPNPTDNQVDEGLAKLKENDCDFIISFGGGSPHDCAKAIGILATNGGKIHDYEGVNKTTQAMLPVVSINTTAGTAAELTRFSIITDTSRHVKMAIIDWKITPIIAVDDSVLMIGMPKGLTAATGMDALTHAIEAYVSIISNPVTDASALHAMKLIKNYLRDAVNDGTNLKARDMMSYAEFLAGMAFNSASLGYVHAMAHQLGGLYILPHGVCNAVLLPVVQEFNAKEVPILFIDIAEAFGHHDIRENAELAVERVLRDIRSLSKDVGIPRNLQELGVKPEDFELLAENTMKDACGFTNPRKPTKEEVIELFRLAYEQ